MPNITQLESEQRTHYMNDLREARLRAQADAEGFDEIVFAVERLGRFLTDGYYLDGKGKPNLANGLGNYLQALQDLVEHETGTPDDDFRKVLAVVKDGRNSRMHEGAFARHVTEKAIRLSVYLEDALMPSETTKLKDVMAGHPMTAKPWEQLSAARQKMLANSFSYLPLFHGNRWQLLADYHIAAYLVKLSKTKQRERLSEALTKAIQNGLWLETPRICKDSVPISDCLDGFEAATAHIPILVMRADANGECGADDLVGIVTPYDLL